MSQITPRSEDFSAWYNDVIMRAQLADYSPVRGCMVIRPWGFRIWELMQGALDGMFKATGHENAYFPLFIPQSFLAREAEHVEGFAKEVALVTHTRLKATGEGGVGAVVVDPASALEEPLVVRPTSETIIYAMLSKWIQSYRDLPLKLNQWSNVVRWEMRTRLFLRTTEFLWQEGHTVHAAESEAETEAQTILRLYRTFMEDWMALPVITGVKTDAEKFAGAVRTYALEGLMQDNKGLQAGTSHFLGQNFAKAFDTKYQTESGSTEFVWSTSWGVSTRLIGALIMTHGDDVGVVLPPRLAPREVVIVPIWKSEVERGKVLPVAHRLQETLRAGGQRVELDEREGMKPGAKYYEWEGRGVPVRLEVGPKDVDKQQAVLARRTGGKEPVPLADVPTAVRTALADVQRCLLQVARERREANSLRGVIKDQLIEYIEGGGGFAYGGYCGRAACETAVKERTKATIRLLPDEEFRSDPAPTACAWCGGAASAEAVWARAY